MITDFSLLPDILNLGVIPIIVNAGAAGLPAIIGALGSALAILFKPRALAQACRRRPWVPILILLLGVGIYFLFTSLWGGNDTSAEGHNQEPGESANTTSLIENDWDEVALEIIRAENRQQSVAQNDATNGTQNEPAEDDALFFRLNRHRNGYDGGPVPLDLNLAWDYSVNKFSHVLSSPIVHEGVVYSTATIIDPTGSLGFVTAVDVETGKELWVTKFINEKEGEKMKGFFSSPAISPDGKHLVIGQGLHEDYNCDLLCLDTKTGEVVWNIPTPLHVESSPSIEGDIAVVGAGAVEVGSERKPSGDPEGKGNPGYVFAVRISTGEVLWEYQINDPEGSSIIRDGVVYVGAGINGAKMYALRIAPDEVLEEQGKERLIWEVNTPYPVIGTTTLINDLVLIGGGSSDYVFTAPNPVGVILALDAKTGEERWRIETADSVLGAIAVHKESMLGVAPVRSSLVDGREKGKIIVFDIENEGEVLWDYTFERGGMAMTGPVFTGSHVYAVSNDGFMAVLDVEAKEKVEEHYLNDPKRPGELGMTVSSPILVNGRLITGSETGGLRAYQGSEYK